MESAPYPVIREESAPALAPGEAYAQMLVALPRYARRAMRQVRAGGRDHLILGTGENHENPLRTLGSFVFAGAVLYSESRRTGRFADIAGQELLSWLRSCVAFMTASHVSGDGECVGGGRWGCEWQSAWWAAKMALGARLIWGELSEEQSAGVQRVVAAESDRFIGIPARTGLFKDTKAEENAWDTEVLAVALALMPSHRNAAAWRASLIDYALNTLSAPQDLLSAACVDGKPLGEQVYTVNVHSDYLLENHNHYHFCYVASAMHSLVWSYYAMWSPGLNIPESLLHNVLPMWQRVRSTFLDNRFAYVGGQDWARYTYGMYFMLPVLALLGKLHDDKTARTIERVRLDRFAEEMRLNDDGSFFGNRVTRGRMFGQWIKYETDCYANVAMGYLMHKGMSGASDVYGMSELRSQLRARHVSPEGGLCFSRTDKLFASFSWECVEGPFPIALFVPNGMDDATEWTRNNLMGIVEAGIDPGQTLSQRRMRATDDGFKVEGRIMYRAKDQWRFDHDLMVELIEGEGLMIIESRFRARDKLLVRAACGLRMHLANDIFNNCRRQLHSDRGTLELMFQQKPSRSRLPQGLVRKAASLVRCFGWSLVEKRRPLAGRWINIDDRIGVVADAGAGELSVVSSGARNAPWNSLYYEKVELGASGLRLFRPGELILHARYILVDGDRQRTAEISARAAEYSDRRLRAVELIS
jgi:hypothetical protein